MTDRVRRVSRVLRDLVEPIAANVYFAPEAHAAYEELGLEGFSEGYFPSRGGCMGQVAGYVVAAAFGVFNPDVVKDAVDAAWSKTTVGAVIDARYRGATASLTRLLGEHPEGIERATELLTRAAAAGTVEGRHLFAGLRSLGFPGEPMGDLWRAADLVREHRGDSHVCAYASYGLTGIEANLLCELWWRMPLRGYTRSRGWSEEQIETAIEGLRDRGIIKGEEFSAEGEALRAAVEAATDRQEAPLVEALGDDADELFALIDPWATAICAGGGYPADPRTFTRP